MAGSLPSSGPLLLPLTATAMVAATGDIYYGLWYPIVVAVMTLIIGSIFLTETKDRDIRTYDHPEDIAARG